MYFEVGLSQNPLTIRGVPVESPKRLQVHKTGIPALQHADGERQIISVFQLQKSSIGGMFQAISSGSARG
jgi:hypothetical protein